MDGPGHRSSVSVLNVEPEMSVLIAELSNSLRTRSELNDEDDEDEPNRGQTLDTGP